MKAGQTNIKIIYDAVNKILEFTKGMYNVTDLTSNVMAWDAVKMNLVLIYETYLKLNGEIKNQYSSVPWHEIEEHKPILESQYLGFDSEEIWRVIHEKMPEFKDQLDKIYID